MGLQSYLQIFISQFHTQFLLVIVKIPCYDRILTLGSQEYDNGPVILSRPLIFQDFRFRSHQPAIMLHRIIFRSESSRSLRRIDTDQRILFPSPATDTIIIQNGIPKRIFLTAVPR